MEYKNLLQKFNNFNNNINNFYQKIDINSFNQFLKRGIFETINTLWSNMPKFENKNNDNVEIVKDSYKLLALQKLESILYKNGIAALKSDWTPVEVLDYLEIYGELKYLKTRIELTSSQINLVVVEEWKYDSNNNLIMSYTLSKPEILNERESKDLLFNFFNYKPSIENKIPYKIFYNNTLHIGDLALVNYEYFELINRDLQVLLMDGFLSAPWIFAVDTSNFQEKIKKGLQDLANRFIPLNAQVATYNTEPLKLLQGISQSDSLIKKINTTISWVKTYAFMKQDTKEMGTKNLHTAEVQEINSDYEDHIEAKANLRELQLLEYMQQFHKDLNINNIVIFGSTQWLKTDAKDYAVNLDGSVINENAFNNEKKPAEAPEIVKE